MTVPAKVSCASRQLDTEHVYTAVIMHPQAEHLQFEHVCTQYDPECHAGMLPHKGPADLTLGYRCCKECPKLASNPARHLLKLSTHDILK